jgi:hypothetical protein
LLEIIKLFPARESLVSAIPRLGTGKPLTFFYSVSSPAVYKRGEEIGRVFLLEYSNHGPNIYVF